MTTCVHCSHCWAEINDLATKGDRPDPTEGDLTICPLCGLVSVFTGDGTATRRPSRDELERALERPDVKRAVMIADSERKAALGAVEGNGRR